MLPRPRVVWPTLIGALVALDIWADRGEPNGDTLTELVRSVFHPETPVGRVTIATLLGVGGGVLFDHFCKETA